MLASWRGARMMAELAKAADTTRAHLGHLFVCVLPSRFGRCVWQPCPVLCELAAILRWRTRSGSPLLPHQARATRTRTRARTHTHAHLTHARTHAHAYAYARARALTEPKRKNGYSFIFACTESQLANGDWLTKDWQLYFLFWIIGLAPSECSK